MNVAKEMARHGEARIVDKSYDFAEGTAEPITQLVASVDLFLRAVGPFYIDAEVRRTENLRKLFSNLI
jgi:hypothetical protein